MNEIGSQPGPSAEAIERARRVRIEVGAHVLEVLPKDQQLLVITQPEPYAAAAAGLPRSHVRWNAASLDEADLEQLVHEAPEADVVVGLGGGMALDAAKFVAWRRGSRLVLVPTIISVDACVTNTIAVRSGGSIEYRGFVVADAVLVPTDIVQAAPARLNRAGIGDLLSIHTALNDWRRGGSRGGPFDEHLALAARAVFDTVEAGASEIADVSDAGIELIVRSYASVNALCLDAGHSQPEEGSEHYFAYALEAVVEHGFVHGEVVGLGTVLMAELQGNDPRRVRSLLATSGVDWSLGALRVTQDQLRTALMGLPDFVQQQGLPSSVLDRWQPDLGDVERLVGIAASQN